MIKIIKHRADPVLYSASSDRKARLKNEMGLKCIQKKKIKATTNSKHKHPVTPNLRNQKFEVSEPGMVIEAVIQEWIEVFYCRIRRHSA